MTFASGQIKVIGKNRKYLLRQIKVAAKKINSVTDPEHCRGLTRAIEAALQNVPPAGEEVEQRWKALKEAVYSASRETLAAAPTERHLTDIGSMVRKLRGS